MRAGELNRAIHEHLFTGDDFNVFAALDGASAPDLLDRLYGLLPEFECLFRGELEPDIAQMAPYLVLLEPNSEFTRWVITHGWGQHWGVFAVSTADLRALRSHFRTLLTVYDGTGRPMLFRYYDPRVLRTYLPTCNSGELSSLFGPVVNYIMEDADPWTLLKYGLDSGALSKEEFALEDAVARRDPGASLWRAQG